MVVTSGTVQMLRSSRTELIEAEGKVRRAYPRILALAFFFFFEFAVKVRQLPTRCSRVSVLRISQVHRKAMIGHTFPSLVFFSLALLLVDLLLFLACFQTFIGKIHLDSSIKT